MPIMKLQRGSLRLAKTWAEWGRQYTSQLLNKRLTVTDVIVQRFRMNSWGSSTIARYKQQILDVSVARVYEKRILPEEIFDVSGQNNSQYG